MAERILQDIAEQKKRLAIVQINENTAEKARAFGDRAGSAGRAYAILGSAHHSLGDSQRAIEYHNQELRIAKDVGNRVGEGCAYGHLGGTYYRRKEFQRAIEYTNKYLSIAKEVGDRACQGKAYASLGVTYHSLNEFQRAIEYANKYLSIAKEVGDTTSLSGEIWQVGWC